MQQPDQFKDYAALVCSQLRWKKARPVVAREIETHLRDQYDSLVRGGMGEKEAVDESIRQMGDAVEIGASLDRVHRPKPSWSLLILTGILLLAGLGIHLFVAGDDSVFSDQRLRYVMAAIVGIGCLLGAYFLDFTILGKRPLLFFIGAILLSAWLGIPSFGHTHIVAQLTLLLPLAYAVLLYGLRGKRYLGLFLSLGSWAFLCTCCCIPLFTGGLLIMAAAGIVLLAAAVWGDWFQVGKRRGLILLGALVLVGAAALSLRVWSSAYMIERIHLLFHPELDPTGRGWAGMLIRETLAGAQPLGEGALGAYGASVPAVVNDADFLLTFLIHRTGWISFFVLMAVFFAFFAAAVYKCLKQKNMLGRLVSLSVILTLALQVLLYVCSNLGLLVGTLPLPLVSYGNTALVVDLALIGVMLSTFRTGSLVRDGEQPLRCGAKRLRWADRVRWKDGELTISFKKDIAL